MARRLLTSDDLIAKKNDNLTIWHMSLVQFRGQKRGHCFSELSDHPLRIVPEWGECISKIFKLIILGRIYSYGFDWHAIKHWTPFTHSPPFIHCYCSQWGVPNNPLFAVTLVPVFLRCLLFTRPATILLHHHLCVKKDARQSVPRTERDNCGPS